MHRLFPLFVLLISLATSASAGSNECAAYYGDVFPCGSKKCAKADADYQLICVLGPQSFPASQNTCDVYYGSVFSCGGKQCAKSDPDYKNICVLTPQSRPYGGSPQTYDSIVKVLSLTADAGCGENLDFDVAKLSEFDPTSGSLEESLRVYFQDFVLATDQAGTYRRSCNLDAIITVPAGYRFRPVSAAAEGSYSILPKGESTGTIAVDYSVEPQGWHASRSNAQSPWSGQGEISCSAELENLPTLHCPSSSSTTKLHSTIALSLIQGAQASSQIEIDSTKKDVDLSWKWQLETCSAFFEGRDFLTSYIAYSGRRIAATMRLNGRTGFYRTDSFTGQLYELQYTDGGKVVRGRWKAEGQSGSFYFIMIDASLGYFNGTWQDGKNPEIKKTWSGNYL